MTSDFKEPYSFFKTIKIPLQYKNPDINLPIISNAIIISGFLYCKGILIVLKKL